MVPTGARNREAIARATEEVLHLAGLSEADIKATVSTGYGRDRVDKRLAAVTEITCHARGVEAVLPGTKVLVDIGGQDSKAIRLDGKGRVLEFAMNDKCAAGTGRFLEAMARALQVDIEQLSRLGRGASANLTLSSMCTVFAESEVVSLIAEGVEVNEIVNGLNRAIASRTAALVKRIAPDINGCQGCHVRGSRTQSGCGACSRFRARHGHSRPPAAGHRWSIRSSAHCKRTGRIAVGSGSHRDSYGNAPSGERPPP